MYQRLKYSTSVRVDMQLLLEHQLEDKSRMWTGFTPNTWLYRSFTKFEKVKHGFSYVSQNWNLLVNQFKLLLAGLHFVFHNTTSCTSIYHRSQRLYFMYIDRIIGPKDCILCTPIYLRSQRLNVTTFIIYSSIEEAYTILTSFCCLSCKRNHRTLNSSLVSFMLAVH